MEGIFKVERILYDNGFLNALIGDQKNKDKNNESDWNSFIDALESRNIKIEDQPVHVMMTPEQALECIGLGGVLKELSTQAQPKIKNLENQVKQGMENFLIQENEKELFSVIKDLLPKFSDLLQGFAKYGPIGSIC